MVAYTELVKDAGTVQVYEPVVLQAVVGDVIDFGFRVVFTGTQEQRTLTLCVTDVATEAVIENKSQQFLDSPMDILFTGGQMIMPDEGLRFTLSNLTDKWAEYTLVPGTATENKFPWWIAAVVAGIAILKRK